MSTCTRAIVAAISSVAAPTTATMSPAMGASSYSTLQRTIM